MKVKGKAYAGGVRSLKEESSVVWVPTVQPWCLERPRKNKNKKKKKEPDWSSQRRWAQLCDTLGTYPLPAGFRAAVRSSLLHIRIDPPSGTTEDTPCRELEERQMLVCSVVARTDHSYRAMSTLWHPQACSRFCGAHLSSSKLSLNTPSALPPQAHGCSRGPATSIHGEDESIPAGKPSSESFLL